MSNDRTDQISTAFFSNATTFNIGRGRFRTVAGNSYMGCHPAQLQLDPKAPPPTISTNAYFDGASDFEILEGDFDTIRGDAVDVSGRHIDGSGEYLTISGPLCVTMSNPMAPYSSREAQLFDISRTTRLVLIGSLFVFIPEINF
jgi:hypothetical protein